MIAVSETLNYFVEEVMFLYIDIKLVQKPLARFAERYGAALRSDRAEAAPIES